MDYYKFLYKLFICLLIVIIFLIYLSSYYVFAVENSINLIPYNQREYNLVIDINNQICKLNDVSIDSAVWEHKNMAFCNYSKWGRPFLGVFVWDDGDFKVGVNTTGNGSGNFIYNSNGFYYRFIDFAMNYNFSSALSNYSHTSYVSYDNESVNFNNYIFSTADILNGSNNVVVQATHSIVYPEITNSIEELQNLNFTYLTMNLHDFSTEDVYLLCYDFSTFEETENTTTDDYNKMFTDMVSDVISLYTNGVVNNSSSNETQNENAEDVRKLYPIKELRIKDFIKRSNTEYAIAFNDLGIDYKNGGKYAFRFALRSPLDEPIVINDNDNAFGGGQGRWWLSWWYFNLVL